jgi:hypothetical protein
LAHIRLCKYQIYGIFGGQNVEEKVHKGQKHGENVLPSPEGKKRPKKGDTFFFGDQKVTKFCSKKKQNSKKWVGFFWSFFPSGGIKKTFPTEKSHFCLPLPNC